MSDLIDINEKYVFKVRECLLPFGQCPFRLEDLTCGLDKGCFVIKKLRENINGIHIRRKSVLDSGDNKGSDIKKNISNKSNRRSNVV